MRRLPVVLLCGCLLAVAAQAQSPTAIPEIPALFAVRLTKGPAWDETKGPNEQAGMREHSANIARLRREGILVHGARFGELGLLVLRLPDEAAVRQQLAADPTIAAQVFSLQVDRFAPFAHGTTAWPMTPEAVILRAYYDAYNRHDPDAVAALLAEDVRWYSVAGDQVATDAESRTAVRDWLVGYFKSIPSTRSTLQSLEVTGAHLAVRERATWTTGDGQPRAQEALAVYEIRDGLIRRVWYFPATRGK